VVGGRLGPSSGLVQDTDTAFATRYRRFYNRVFTEKELAEFLRPEVYHRTRNLAFNALQDSFSRSQGGTIYDRWYALELHQRTRRFISYQLDLLATVSRVRAPFLDNELVDFLQTVPVEYRQGKRLIREMIRRFHPDLAAIPVDKNGIAIYDGSRIRRLFRGRWRWLTHHVVPAVSGGRFRVHRWSEYAHYDEWLRTGCHDFVRATLNQTEYLEDVFDIDRVHNLVERHLSGQVNAFEKICALMTFVIWGRNLVGGGHMPVPNRLCASAQ